MSIRRAIDHLGQIGISIVTLMSGRRRLGLFPISDRTDDEHLAHHLRFHTGSPRNPTANGKALLHHSLQAFNWKSTSTG